MSAIQTIDTLNNEQRLTLLGEVAWLALHSETHRGYWIETIERVFLTPIELGQFRIYRRGGLPMGFVTWAWLNAAAERDFIADARDLEPEDWRGGDRLWYMDMIAPFGDGPAIIRDIRRNVMTNRSGKATRRDLDGALRRVVTFPAVDRDGRRAAA